MSTTLPKSERLEARVTSEQKAAMRRAAALQGRSLTDFMVSALQDAAYEAIHRHEVLDLSTRDSVQFVEALLGSALPNEHLVSAAQRHTELIGK
jgi:uncharacterized protein (DUF1778 family)